MKHVTSRGGGLQLNRVSKLAQCTGFCLEDWDGNPDPRKVGIVKKSTIPDTWDCCGSVIVLNPTIPAEPLTIPVRLGVIGGLLREPCFYFLAPRH